MKPVCKENEADSKRGSRQEPVVTIFIISRYQISWRIPSLNVFCFCTEMFFFAEDHRIVIAVKWGHVVSIVWNMVNWITLVWPLKLSSFYKSSTWEILVQFSSPSPRITHPFLHTTSLALSLALPHQHTVLSRSLLPSHTHSENLNTWQICIET